MDLQIEASLIPVFETESSRLKLQQQIAKDFNTIQIEFPQEFTTQVVDIKTLVELVHFRLITALELGERKTLQLLYAIDISEQLFLKALHNKELSQSLTVLVLEREAKKIYFRMKFS